jgi:hypothetical protein
MKTIEYGEDAMLRFHELSNEQRRQLIDSQQLYRNWREAARRFSHSYEGNYAGSMRWVKRNGSEYLYRKLKNTERSLGKRSPETEAIKAEYVAQRIRWRTRLRTMTARIDQMAPVNRALRLGRVPNEAAKIIRGLDEAGLMGRHLVVVGTNSLFAYETRAGVQFGRELVATEDADFLWDARRSLGLAMADVRAEGVIGILKKVDRTFSTGPMYGYSAVNDRGYIVELICPQERDFMTRGEPKVSDAAGELTPMPIEGLQWLLNAPKFEEVVIAEDGRPLQMACVDPRVFALHKLWLSRQNSRQPLKRPRDAAQSHAVAALCNSYFALDFGAKELSALPTSIRDLRSSLTDEATTFLEPTDTGW